LKRVVFFLFYLCLLLLPTQLGRHFFFDFSLISGIRSDYLAPTVYLTDIVIVLMIILEITHEKISNSKHQITNKHQIQNTKLQVLNFKQKCLNVLTKSDLVLNFKNWNLFRICNLRFWIFLFVFFYLLFSTLFVASNKWAALYKLVKLSYFL